MIFGFLSKTGRIMHDCANSTYNNLTAKNWQKNMNDG